jgi:hypothetical protein
MLRNKPQQTYINGEKTMKIENIKFDKTELAKGIKVEMEHTKDPKMAEKIAKDHLKENPKYYSILAKCMPEEH